MPQDTLSAHVSDSPRLNIQNPLSRSARTTSGVSTTPTSQSSLASPQLRPTWHATRSTSTKGERTLRF
ncbi:hypothetical protein P692DRAFT_20119654 [Suillus brevipes Sb2]|nr:hypothetical protein P692DRAFT_20119654 [Suillus brevipes Sb2]